MEGSLKVSDDQFSLSTLHLFSLSFFGFHQRRWSDVAGWRGFPAVDIPLWLSFNGVGFTHEEQSGSLANPNAVRSAEI